MNKHADLAIKALIQYKSDLARTKLAFRDKPLEQMSKVWLKLAYKLDRVDAAIEWIKGVKKHRVGLK